MECGKQALSYTDIISYYGQVLMILHILTRATNLSGSLSRKRLLKTQ
jgi:hypothetical protein